MAAHHRCDRSEVGRAADRGVDDGRHLAEVLGAEEARSDDRERRRVDVPSVVERVDDVAGDKESLAGPDLGRRAVDRPGQDALEPVDRLLVAVVAVAGGDAVAARSSRR